MQIEFTEDQKMLHTVANDFLAAECPTEAPCADPCSDTD